MKKFILGPLALEGTSSKIIGLMWTLFLTLFTQVGGIIVWPFWSLVYSMCSSQRPFIRFLQRTGIFFVLYTSVSLIVIPIIAKQTGRTRLPIFASKEVPVAPLTLFYPLLNRNYVRIHTYETFVHAAKNVAEKDSEIVIRYLDAGFPFPYIPLLPHLSHHDGQKIDVAFQFQKDGLYVDQARSPIGYWGYVKESKKRTECDKPSKNTIPLRWDFDWLQPLLPDLSLDVHKNRTLLSALAAEKDVCLILLEPTLHSILDVPKLHANSCSVARHDDHFHVSIQKKCTQKK